MAQRNIFSSTLVVLLISIIVFFAIFFLSPSASVQFFGVGYKYDANDISNFNSVNMIIKEAKSLKTFSDEELVVLKDLLSSNSIISNITNGKQLSKDQAKEIAKYYSTGTGKAELETYVKAKALYSSADDFAKTATDAALNFASSLKNLIGN